jgi:hypothetical protein
VFVLCVLLAACSSPAANTLRATNPTSAPVSTPASHEMSMTTPAAQPSGSGAQPTPAPTISIDGWLTYTSRHYGYKIRYPGDWKIDVQPATPNQPNDQETVIFSKPAVGASGLAAQIMFHAARNEYMTKPPECQHRPEFKGVKACHDSLPKGQNPAQEIMTFEKDGVFFTAQLAYDEPGAAQVFKAVLSTFEFAQ